MDAGVSGWVHHLVVDASLKYCNCYASRPFYRLVCLMCFAFCVLFFVFSTQQQSTSGHLQKHEAIRRTLSLHEPTGPHLDATDLTVKPFGFEIKLQPSARGTFKSCHKTDLLIVVCSAVQHSDRRMAIRETWGSAEALAPLNAAVVFALGSRPAGEEAVHVEAEQFGDILQGDFEDTYMNLTLKSTMLLKYVSGACGDGKKAPRFVMKTDDDIFVNVPLLVAVLKKNYKEAEKVITGCAKQKTAPKGISMDGRTAPSLLPDFVAGAGYVMSGPLVTELYAAARRVRKPLKMEDIFVTAQCAQLVPGAHPPRHDPRFSCGGIIKDDCELVSLFTGHHITPQRQSAIWDKFTSDPNPCMDF
ncbi:beta-1,3-galactosyltransferase 5-like [Neocloeon triangulifer]|uniref:beta-1,3-galactosyltransferase 5-like n=1 Tax=Neocloeon triangulifer TaxID=2078957 RepID=UPI00286F0DAB|nr:beta-1,3-galactosyltransferase 5-like [Neocloeon triangulifer]